MTKLTLTDADNIELESAEKQGLRMEDITAETTVNRWTKKGDRLYINAPIAKLEKYKTYVDLETGDVRCNNEHAFGGHTEIDGNTATVTIVDKKYDDEHTLVLTLDGDAFEASDEDDENDESEPELVCDGGEDVTDHVSDAAIEAAIEDCDDTEHPDCTTVVEVRDLLSALQRNIVEGWAVYMDHVENGDIELVAQEDDVVVFATGEHRMYDQELGSLPDEVADISDDVTRDVLNVLMHKLARQYSNYEWGYSYPLVVRKPKTADAERRYIEAVVNSLQREGLSPAQAWAVYGVDVCGYSQRQWATRTGRAESTISTARSESSRKAGYLGIFK